MENSEITAPHLSFAGDIESNPGPFWKKEEDPIENLQNIVDDQADEISDLKENIEKQSDTINELKGKLEELSINLTALQSDNGNNIEDILKVKRSLENDKKSNAKLFEELSENDSKFGQELLLQKVREIQ